MTNPYYTRLFDVNPLTFARSGEVEAEYDRVEQGFDGLDAALAPNLAEVAAARQGQASLALNLQRFVTTFSPATGSVDMGGYTLNNVANPVSAQQPATKGYTDALAFAAALPAQAGNAGKVVRTSGTAASWGNWWGTPVRLTPANNGLVLTANTTYELDSRTGAFGVTLPVLAVGDWVKLVDVGGALATNNVTVGRNGQLIRNDTLDLICDANFDSFELVRTSDGVIEQ